MNRNLLWILLALLLAWLLLRPRRFVPDTLTADVGFGVKRTIELTPAMDVSSDVEPVN